MNLLINVLQVNIKWYKLKTRYLRKCLKGNKILPKKVLQNVTKCLKEELQNITKYYQEGVTKLY